MLEFILLSLLALFLIVWIWIDFIQFLAEGKSNFLLREKAIFAKLKAIFAKEAFFLRE